MEFQAASPYQLGNYDFVTDSDNIFRKHPEIMELRMFISCDDNLDLREHLHDIYISQIMKNNLGVFDNPFPDSGFDLCIPQINTEIAENVKIDFNVKFAAFKLGRDGSRTPTGYYLYPRSSLSKKHLRLANSVGIIDSGYRGNIMGVFDCKYMVVDVHVFEKIVQICSPSLCPIYVRLVNTAEELSDHTIRGADGFGSTDEVFPTEG
jgi:dUTP pyrophosphatase